MTERQGLSPPDPSRDGWYWLSHSSKTPQVWEWCVDGAEGSWRRDSAEGSGREMALWGYALASPHPIPGPEQLEELYRDAATTAAFRAALGAKP